MLKDLVVDDSSDGIVLTSTQLTRQWHLLNNGQNAGFPGANISLAEIGFAFIGVQAGMPEGGLQFNRPGLGGSWNSGMVVAAETGSQVAQPAHGAAVKGSASHAIELYSIPTDTLFNQQWHLRNTGQNGGTPGVDINVTTVWDEFTGAGVHVGIWDDGVQYTHHDLDGNYDATLHIPNTSGGGTHDPLPQDPGSAHGTAVAGLIAGENNGVGTVGVAYGASITGIDMFFDPQIQVENSTQYLQNFDVTNHSWGYTTPFVANILDTSAYWTSFFGGILDSVINGRGGLGTINLVANGNDRTIGRDGNDSNFTNMPQTIAVAAVDHTGFVSYYSSPGANLLVATTSNGLSGIWTTDRTGADGYSTGANEAGNTEADYTATFGGTSAATPITAGVVALMLDANPNLGWRDVQEILAVTARHTGTDVGAAAQFNELYEWHFNGSSDWNGGGLHFSNDYGFGLTDALAAVRLAESWNEQSTSSNWATTVSGTWTGPQVITDDGGAAGNAVTFTFDVLAGQAVDLETVGLNLVFDASAFTGDYLITLTSPDGTTSILSRPQNNGDSATNSWFFTSNEFRGETGVGTWTVSIDDQWSGDQGSVLSGQLEFYGATVDTTDTHVFTNEFSNYAGLFGHSTAVNDTNGGLNDTLNAAAVSLGSIINLALNSFTIDGTAGTTTGFENAIGGDGNDQFTGSTANNLLEGWRGNDSLVGGLGDDQINGGAGTGDRAFFTGAVAATVNLNLIVAQNTGYGLDTLLGIENITSGNGNDRLTGNALGNSLSAGIGIDILDGGSGADALFGGDDNDSLTGGIGNDRIDGGAGTGDRAFFTGSVAAIVNLNLVVAQNTGHGVDILLGIEHISSGNGNDQLTGNTADNSLSSGLGTDNLDGGIGNDTLIGGAGGDVLNGGAGDDLASYATATAGVIANLLVPATNTGDAAGDTYVSIEWLTGSSHNDQLYGNNLANRLAGGAGNDVLRGLLGNDLIWGQAGSDIFLFNTALNAATNVDRIIDYAVVDDTIYLENAIFTALGAGALAAAAFAANATGLAGDASDRVIYETDTGKLFYDANGIGGIAGVHFATLTAGLALTAADFLVI